MRILLSHSYFYYFDPKQWKAQQPYPPLGTLYAASVLRNAGHEVAFIDNALERSTGKFRTVLSGFKPDVVVLYDDGFNYLTKMCLTNMREAAFEMIKMAGEQGIPSVLSSSDSTDHSELYLQKGASYIIIGEGEVTLEKLIGAIEHTTDPLDVDGISMLKDGREYRTRPRPVLRDLDEIPFPAWDLVDMDRYRKIWVKKHGYFSLNVSTTRGCPYKCNWCAKPIYGNKYNSRSPEKVVEEMTLLTDEYHADHFWITDDIFGLKRNWVHGFNDAVQQSGKKFHYKIQSRVDLMLKDENLRSMVDSGMDEVWVGAESGSQKILDAMDKGTDVDQIREATRLVQSYGRKICFFLQFGYLDEDERDIKKTVDLLLELMPDDIGISVSYPLPGTGFYEKVKGELKHKANWTDSDDLDMMYSGTFSKEYYRKLHRKVHKMYRRKQGLNYLMKPLYNWKHYGFTELRSILLSLIYYTPLSIFDGLRGGALQSSMK